MKFTEKMKLLAKSEKVQEETLNLLESIVDVLLGNPIAAGKIAIFLAKNPFFIRDQLFWEKMDAFLNGVYLDETDCRKLAQKLTEDGKNKDNPLRLIACIERAETLGKIEYLINATRSLLAGFIELPTYFRICYAVTHTMEEDLEFLKEHILEEETFPYSIHIQGLLTSGLVHMTKVGGEENRYVFVPIAKLVDCFAVSYNNTERYPNPLISIDSQSKLKTAVEIEWDEYTASEEEVNEMFSEMFGKQNED